MATKTFPKHLLMEISGILSYKEAEKLELSIAESRKRSRERMTDIAKELR